MCHLSNKLACLPGRNCSAKIYIHIILFELPFPNLFKNGEVFKSPWTASLSAPFPAPSKVIICQEPRAVPWLVTLLIGRNKPVPRSILGPSPSLSAFLLLLRSLGGTAEHLVFSTRRALYSSPGCQRCKDTPARPTDEGQDPRNTHCQGDAPCHEATGWMKTLWRPLLLLLPTELTKYVT